MREGFGWARRSEAGTKGLEAREGGVWEEGSWWDEE